MATTTTDWRDDDDRDEHQRRPRRRTHRQRGHVVTPTGGQPTRLLAPASPPRPGGR
jgi:hypothetical protein